MKDQRLGARAPRQERARQKVELILEAAMRLMDRGGIAALTTNAVAEKAGVSIGTLYQYFANKEAILDALADRETAGLAENVVAALDGPADLTVRERVGRIVTAVAGSYGGRPTVHRIVMEHSLQRGGKRLAPLIDRLIGFLASDARHVAPFSPADAFVLTHAFAGVMRAIILVGEEAAPPPSAVEDALTRLILGFAPAA